MTTESTSKSSSSRPEKQPMSINNRVCVCVLGDIGHSPRMQYHSLSLVDQGFHVDIVAYQESKPHEELISNNKIKIHKLPMLHNNFVMNYLPRTINYFLKVFLQSICLFWNLMLVAKPDYILVQNPPSVPSLPIVWLVCRLRKSKFVVDWHNYGHTIMALTLKPGHPLVKLYKNIEFYFGQKADFSFCVSRSMKNDLKRWINNDSIVLYDRPYSFFQPMTSLEEKHLFFVKLQAEYFEIEYQDQNETLFTKYSLLNDQYQLKTNRPVILISSTSWTEDEDFQMLLDALYEFDHLYAKKVIKNDNDLKVVCFITGKGPLKQYYMEQVQHAYSFNHTKFVFPWLSAEDYPKLLACADLGICLHKSSSGLDLPMKILDMFGSRLPVCAYNYQSIIELVIPDQNGNLFDKSATLVQCLITLLKEFPNCQKLVQMRKCIDMSFKENHWKPNWQKNALPVFRNRN